MSSVQQSIRDAISRSNARTTEERNAVYLAARSAIEQLPHRQSEPAMHELFEAIKEIETEYAREELAEAGGAPLPEAMPEQPAAQPETDGTAPAMQAPRAPRPSAERST